MADFIVRRIMKRNVRWRIGMFPSGRQQAVISEAMVLQPPKGRFSLIPLYIPTINSPIYFRGLRLLLAQRDDLGRDVLRRGFPPLGTALNLPYHLSFPYIFEYEGVTYMVPETCGNRSIELWKCTDFPLKWELQYNLMSNVSAVDTIIFKHGEYWWLLTNIDRTDGQSHCDELFAFFADSPLSTNGRRMPATPSCATRCGRATLESLSRLAETSSAARSTRASATTAGRVAQPDRAVVAALLRRG